MESLASIARRYQSCDTETGEYTADRSMADFAALLGLHQSFLTRLYNGQTLHSPTIARALARTFPQSRHEVAMALLRVEEAANVSLAV